MKKKNKTLRKRINPFIRNFSLFLLISFMSFNGIFAQALEITGTITDETGEGLPGVSIAIKGSPLGTITDLDGNYTLSTNTGDIIVISFVGYLDKEIEITNQSDLSIQLETDLVGLDEVVVIGYGVQKKKLNTGATINLKGEDLQKLNTVSAIDALQGNSPGVTITPDNGVPGSNSKVIIRGTGTMGDASPLYIVDGVPVGNINFLSPSDIASIDILKDAASTAIYGARAANGVIMVSTKKGSTKSKMTTSYDAFYGWQQFAKRPDMVNAKTYMELMEEAYSYEDRPIDWESATGLDYWEDYQNGTNPGTNWIDELYNKNAPTQSHALNITGGNEVSSVSVGLGYVSQEGIIGFPENSTYKRMNARINSEHILAKSSKLNILKVGQNLSYSNWSNPNIATGNIYWNDLHNAIVRNPLMPIYADETTEPEYGEYHQPLEWDPLAANPVAIMEYNRKTTENANNNFVGNFYAAIEPIKNLVLRSSYGFDGGFGSSRNYSPISKLSTESFSIRDNVSQESYERYTWTWSNTLTYNFNVFNKHNITAMVGHESRKTTKDSKLHASNDSTQYQDWEHAYISLTHDNYSKNLSNMWAYDYKGYAMLSYFGRISYDYNETLLATFVYRADASNNLAPGHQWGDFVSFSLGYILTNHDFMDAIPALNYLKIRGGWGQNGNERIKPFQYAASLVNAGASYPFGLDNSVTTTGTYPAINPNPFIGWETSEQANIGFDANFLNNRLQFNFDWYNKTTQDWLVTVPAPKYYGSGGTVENGGAVKNNGIEMALRWSDRVGEFSYSVGGNLAYNKNEVTEIRNEEGYFNGNANILNQGSSYVNRVEIGYPIGYFRGFETDGIIQEGEEDLYAFTDSLGVTKLYFANQRAGDLKFVDKNQDGKINEEDKVMIGDPNPDYTFGFNLSAEYKGIYFAATAYGKAGHQIAMSYRPGSKDNFTEYHLDRWTAENPSNTQPRFSASSAHRNYLNVSDYYIHDANFLRISNITIGYDINKLFKNSPLEETRLYFTGQNLFTFTKYPGMDPEVGYGGGPTWGSGIDLGLYPASKTYMVGLSVTF